jgi:hypothetical protein
VYRASEDLPTEVRLTQPPLGFFTRLAIRIWLHTPSQVWPSEDRLARAWDLADSLRPSG